MFADDAPRDREAETGALVLLSGEERLEDLTEVLFGNSHAVIRHRDIEHALPVARPQIGGHADLSVVAVEGVEGVDGVDKQVDQHRVEPVVVGKDAEQILAAERVALNILQHMSGVATLTSRYVEACEGTGSRVLCTRKTLPGLRSLERYAVEAGGGSLHRGGLDDGVLIKRNHLRLAGGVAEAVTRAKASVPHTLKVEVEVETLEELEQAIVAGADAILLDNADLATIERAAHLLEGRILLEISGGVNLDTIADIAAVGHLLISIGRLTHSAPAMDIALEVAPS